MKTKHYLLLVFFSIMASIAQSKVILPHLISDHMIIQQNIDFVFWGKSSPNKTIKVRASWATEAFTTTADNNGNFSLSIATPQASFVEHDIHFSDGEGEETIVSHVLIGDVWVCAGQSNMEMPVKGFDYCPVENYNETVVEAANNRGIRAVKIPSVMSMKPLNDAVCSWKICDSNNVSNVSAVGYYFARLISKTLHIPIGLIEANKGGSRVESWLNSDNLAKYTQEPIDTLSIVRTEKLDYQRTLLWGNGTFSPILNYKVKGILFYQGCSNVGYHRDDYARRLSILVDQWRNEFNEGNIPFYFVEIAPFNYGSDNINGALLREQQSKALALIPNSAMVCTNDCVYPYEYNQIHPTQKKKVGERLAFLALNQTYGLNEIIAMSPSLEHVTFKDGKAIILLKNMFGGTNIKTDIQGFEIAGMDKKFYSAKAWIDISGRLIVESETVQNPVSVRYCFKNFQLGNLKNMGGLPLFPFRTDSW